MSKAKDFVIYRINIRDIIRDSVKLYKENFKQLMFISLIGFLLNIFDITTGNIRGLLTNSPGIYLVYTLLLVIITIPLLYFNIKISITLYVYISFKYKNRDIDIRGSYNRAGLKFWRYAGVTLQYAMINILPIVGILVSYRFVNNLAVKCILIVTFLLPILYFGTIYFFAPLGVIVEEGKRKLFKVSKELVEGDFWRIILILFLINIVLRLPYDGYIYIYGYFEEISRLQKLIASLINRLLFLFATPFTYSVAIVTYFRLKSNKRIG